MFWQVRFSCEEKQLQPGRSHVLSAPLDALQLLKIVHVISGVYKVPLPSNVPLNAVENYLI